MEKLIELLNKYETETKIGGSNFWSWQDNLEGLSLAGEVLKRPYSDLFIISKRYCFIRWLVDNDKIDFTKIKRVFYKTNENNTATYPVMSAFSDYECLLMLLSISDTPIEFLCSILR